MLPLWTSNAAVATKPRRQGRTLTSSEKKAGQTWPGDKTIEQLEFVPKVAQSYPSHSQVLVKLSHTLDRLIGHTERVDQIGFSKAHNAIRHLADYVLVLALLFAVWSDLDGDESASSKQNSPIGP